MEIWIKHNINNTLINAWRSENSLGAYAYNLFGNQVSFTPEGVLYTYYTYRPDGLRHSIGDKVHVWDGANIVADIDGNNVSVYIIGINLIYADDGDKTYYHFNAHGDIVVLTNESGNKTKSYSYNAFGVEYNEATLDDNPFRYCGEYYDKETKTIYLRARYYNAAQGRFTQEDPIRDGYNWYAYCGGNPVNFIDRTGLSFTKMLDITDDDGLLEGEPLGLSGGGARAYMYLFDSTAYGSYAIRCQTALYDANFGGYHSNNLSSGITNPSAYIVPGAETVTDDMADVVDDSQEMSNTEEKLTEATDIVSDITKGATDTCETTTEALVTLRENQKALSQLGKEIEKNAKNGKFISYEEAKVFDEWCIQYGIPQHHPAELGNGAHWIVGLDHTHFYGRHIPFK